MPDPRPHRDPLPYVSPDTTPAAPPARGRRVIRVGLIVLAACILIAGTPLLIPYGSATPFVLAPALFGAALGLALILNGLLDLLGGRP